MKQRNLEASMGLKKRYRFDRSFKTLCYGSILFAIACLVLLLGQIAWRGQSAFWQSRITLDIFFDEAILDPEGSRDIEAIRQADFSALPKVELKKLFPEVAKNRKQRRALAGLMSEGALYELSDRVMSDVGIIGSRETLSLPLASEVDLYLKGITKREWTEEERHLSDDQINWIDQLRDQGVITRVFNMDFFLQGDSREPEIAGIRTAIIGSFYTMLITLLLSFPLGVAAAIYLEEFAPKERWWTDLIEVNINNLAAVPSIIFGLLGLAVFLNFFKMPRSAPLVGGVVLALMTLPVVVISTRTALNAVPSSIRMAAYGLGATKLQVILHHLLPLAAPGILTGTIIGMARAFGETAPLLMIGMVAFIVDFPGSPMEASTVLPVQVYLWADSPERAFVEKTSAAILVLLVCLVSMNALAIYLRQKWQRKY